MNLSYVPLDSVALARAYVPVRCCLCDMDNAVEAEWCQRCQAPLALARQVHDGARPFHFLAVVGAANAGKTVYLGMLMDILSRHPCDLRLLARGAFSVSLQQEVIRALSRCTFPEKTSNDPDRWNWIHCEIQLPARRRTVQLVVPDLSGEAILEEIEHPDSYPAVGRLLAQSRGLLILVDAVRLAEGESDQDFFAMKVLSFLAESKNTAERSARWWQRRRRGGKSVGIVFTKTDQCPPAWEDPHRFARARIPGTWQLVQEHFPQHRFFAANVVGQWAHWLDGEVRRPIPLRVEPRGIVEPFRWLIENVT